MPTLRGAFCLTFMDEHTLYAARDPQGVRPLVLGRLERGWVVASETAALDIVGASFVREVEPGELITIDENGLRSQRFAKAKPAGCVFEYVYLARPDTTISGSSVYESRVEMVVSLPANTLLKLTWSCPLPNPVFRLLLVTPKSPAFPTVTMVKNAYVVEPSFSPRRLSASSVFDSS